MSEQELSPGIWEKTQKILVILAHPDDPEFFCGATLALWAKAGHQISYLLLTCGDKGRNPYNEHIPAEELCALRHIEQREAAAILGVHDVHFLNEPDGYLTADLALRLKVTRAIRQFKPDILVTCDPQNLFASYGLNHPDHRAAGQAVLDAAFPAAGNALFFPELIKEGLEPHMPSEIWVSLTQQPNVTIDITEYLETKIAAIQAHKCQIGEPEKLAERMRSWRTEDSTPENPRYEEKFKRILYR